jgi:hypothetical protein
MFTKIKEIKSYGYEVSPEINRKKAKIKFATKLNSINAFYINISLKKQIKIRNWVEERTLNDKKTNVIMTVFPSDIIKKQIKKLDPENVEIIFLIDRSGSMGCNLNLIIK